MRHIDPMLTYLRYALAAVCFALSVGSLALWRRSADYMDSAQAISRGALLQLTSFRGSCDIQASTGLRYMGGPITMSHSSIKVDYPLSPGLGVDRGQSRQFRVGPWSIVFPHWFAALVFALAGIGALRFGRRFTLRSAMIATTVVAGLLGMIVSL